MRRADLTALTAFVAVAEHHSFRAAASQLGVTPSALSHSMRRLEEHLGVRLLHRTTRSVAVTDAGLRLVAQLRPAVEQVSRALDNLNFEQGHPFGRLRLYVSHLAVATVIAPLWASFLSSFPDVELELHTAEAPVDIVAKGFDAGIGPKDWAAADMIAVRVLGPMGVAVVGAPDYFARIPPPRIPDELTRHRCIQYRRASGVVFEWPFACDGKSRSMSLTGRVTVNDAELAVRAAVDGLGIAYTIEALANPFLHSGQLIRVLEDWSPSIDGLFLYYPGQRQVPLALRALLDMLRAGRGAVSTKSSSDPSVLAAQTADRRPRAHSLDAAADVLEQETI
jgi:DNA-binding transcriptional LysR family regulator